MDDFIASLQHQAEERQEELFALLAELIAHPTVSPPARNTMDAQRFLERQLQASGFETELWEVYPGDPNVTAVKRGTQGDKYRSLLLNGHMDVAEVGDTSEWLHDPFALTLENGRAYGRGTADMKGGLAALLFAAKLLADAGAELKGDLLFQSVIGEEAGEAGTRACMERGCQADLAVVADTSGLAIQGQGGVITGWVTVQSPVTYHDGMRSRMIHAGGGVQGASAIEKMAKLIAGLQELERHWAVTKSYPGFPPGSNTINPAVIEGGRHAAFIADRCALWITVHFYPNEDYETVTAEIEAHLLAVAHGDPWLRNHPPTFRWGGRSMIEERGEIFPSLELDPNGEGLQALAERHKQVRGTSPAISMSPSVTDAGWIGRAGIPTLIYGPGELANAHAVDESADPRELVDYAKIMIAFIADWCNRIKPESEHERPAEKPSARVGEAP
ncbi:acetylornithine deacetylase [Paenibacillus sacheonensis]|uniref:Probable succinyl-diaminopimelate desuccinylase n=1 Tax=Paenibacillus sacheonensis TaxID=742054 RepID=A0A7X4YSL7_9BACL|nr:acetylornithine deacetylase [Paenibacillus sacheonensis]MBM7568185.1 acetylornithine deacetylase [Paenibacillus sacheonensis]NBC71817.1 acetylornithine deacetylase [Paenibacillus sacheonensis]